MPTVTNYFHMFFEEMRLSHVILLAPIRRPSCLQHPIQGQLMRKPHVLSATRRWHRSDRTLHFLRLFSVNSCPKITHLFLKDFVKTKTIVHQMQRSRDLISFSELKSCRTFPEYVVNRGKSDVMTSFGLIDRIAVFCVIMRAGSSFKAS
jgi:hypothetical protein